MKRFLESETSSNALYGYPISEGRFLSVNYEPYNFSDRAEVIREIKKYGLPLSIREHKKRELVGTIYIDARHVIEIAGGTDVITYPNPEIRLDVTRNKRFVKIQEIERYEDEKTYARERVIASVQLTNKELNFLAEELKNHLDKLNVKW